MNLHLRARNVLAAAAIAAVVATMTGAIAPTRARAVPDAAARPAEEERVARSLLLITGVQLVVRPEPGGRSEIAVRPGAPDHDGLVSLRRGGVTDLIPADALPYLGRGLDPGLFDVPQLLRAEAGGRLPLRITFSGRPPALPGVTVARTGPETAQGYLTSSSARSFGLALMRQFRRDRARGSFGGGLFAGGMTLALAGAPAAPGRPPGRPAAVASHTLTVTGRALSGKPANGTIAWVFSADNMNFSDNIGVFKAGVAKFSVPAGRYWVVGEFDATIGVDNRTRLDVLPQVSVAKDTTVHTAASAATSEVTMRTPRPADLAEVTFTIDFH
jgi:hypothetical protein